MKAHFFILFLCFIFQMNAQERSFSVSISRDTVLMGNVVELRYDVVNLDGDFVPPSLADFHVVAGPNTSQQYSMINGKVTQSATYSYILMPAHEGLLVIDEAVLNNENESISTEPLQLFVLENPDGIIEESEARGLRRIYGQTFSKDISPALTPQDSLRLKLKRLKTKKI
jgi:hypothetical protein